MESNSMPTRRLTSPLTLVAALLATQLLGCMSSDPPVSHAYDPMTLFPATAEFVWDEEANWTPQNASLREEDIGPVIKRLATEAMAVHGYTEAQTGTPPYRLSYQLTIHTWIGQEQSTSTASLAPPIMRL
jgi:hypothetical protein